MAARPPSTKEGDSHNAAGAALIPAVGLAKSASAALGGVYLSKQIICAPYTDIDLAAASLCDEVQVKRRLAADCLLNQLCRGLHGFEDWPKL